MAGTVSAGTIVYEVDMDTARLLQGRRDIDDSEQCYRANNEYARAG